MKVFLFSFFIISSCYSQKKVSIYNSENQTPVSYANIWKDNTFYKTSDSLGVFSIEAKDLNSNLKITAIGFEDKITNASSDKIYLTPEINKLDEVKIVKFKKTQKETLGRFKKAGATVSAVQYDAKLALVAKFIPNDKKEVCFLNKVKFYTETTEKNRIISVVFYSVNERGEPGQIINTSNIICHPKKGTYLNSIDVIENDIIFPEEGIFVVLQYMLLEQNKNYEKESNNPLAFFYEPLLFIKSVKSYTDTWYLKDDANWTKNNFYSLNLGIEVAK